MTVRADRIRVAHVRWGNPLGGVERALRDLAVYRNRCEFEYHFFFMSCGGPYVDEMVAAGCGVTVIPAASGFDPRMRLELMRALRTFKPDVVQEHGVSVLVLPFVRLATQAPLLTYEHGEIPINRSNGRPWRNWIKGVEHRLLMERLVANSDANAALLAASYHMPRSRLQVIHPGIDLERFAEPVVHTATDSARPLRIGYVGRVANSDKGCDSLPHLAEHLVRLGCSDFRLVVVGDGPDRDGMMSAANQLGVADRIDALGYRSDVPDLLAQMDVLVVPSRVESFGLAPLEALAVGTPVVAFAIGGLPEILGSCAFARLVPPGDVAAMAQAILDLRAKNGRRRFPEARQYVAERFDVRNMVRAMEQVYRDTART